MTQLFGLDGELVPVTAIEVIPNLVVAKRSMEKNGYEAVIVGYGEIKKKRINKPNLGQYKNVGEGIEPKRHLYELRGLDVSKYEVGELVKMDELLSVGDCIDVQGTTRGHGFTGAIKLWNYRCGPKSHGAGYPHRFGGSLET
ncbi:50S ribosomal protein L3-like, partial [Rattus rattus]|uniref:50S ribosomal protein L3-like n=1 Tax=Rattus rattus TaxID=10117 RepID=UPI0013F2BECE